MLMLWTLLFQYPYPEHDAQSIAKVNRTLKLVLSELSQLIVSFSHCFDSEMKQWCHKVPPKLTQLGPAVKRVHTLLQQFSMVSSVWCIFLFLFLLRWSSWKMVGSRVWQFPGSGTDICMPKFTCHFRTPCFADTVRKSPKISIVLLMKLRMVILEVFGFCSSYYRALVEFVPATHTWPRGWENKYTRSPVNGTLDPS